MRKGLYMMRHNLRLSQAEIAEKIGCNRRTYAEIENGKRPGSGRFWNNLKTALNISDAEIGGLMQNEEKQA